jgi:ribonuclease P protein subunit RPR2
MRMDHPPVRIRATRSRSDRTSGPSAAGALGPRRPSHGMGPFEPDREGETLSSVQHADKRHRGRVPDMPGGRSPVRGGRRGRRTAGMIRLAQERIIDLFGLAEAESREDRIALSHRYVGLARRIGMRYNVRFLPEYRELYCRGCSAYWIEGRTVRTRLRSGLRIRVCLVCGRARRTVIRARRPTPDRDPTPGPPTADDADPVLVEDTPDAGGEGEEEE